MKSVAHGDAHLYLLDTHLLPTLQLWVQFFQISRCWFELWTFHKGQSHHATSGSLNFLLFHFVSVVVVNSSAHIFRFYGVLADHRRFWRAARLLRSSCKPSDMAWIRITSILLSFLCSWIRARKPSDKAWIPITGNMDSLLCSWIRATVCECRMSYHSKVLANHNLSDGLLACNFDIAGFYFQL